MDLKFICLPLFESFLILLINWYHITKIW